MFIEFCTPRRRTCKPRKKLAYNLMSMKMNWIYNTFYTSLTLIDQIVNLIIEMNYVRARVYIKDLNCENLLTLQLITMNQGL